MNQIPRLKPSRFFLCLILLSSVWGPVQAASILDIGTDYRIRGISHDSPGYGAPGDTSRNYYSQRALAHIGGRFSPNLEFMTQFQAIGVAGSSNTITDPVVNQAPGHYPNTSFTPFIQWAYFKANELHDWPVDLTVGRQPIIWGDGLVLSDDDLGFTGIRLNTRLPWYGLQAEAFTFKTQENFTGHSDTDLYGVQFTKPMKNIRIQLSFVNEHDGSGQTPYVRATENPATITNAVTPGSPVNFNASRITRTFYDARLEGRLLQGGFYKGEFAMQQGKVSRDPSVPGGSVDLGGYAGLISAGLFTRFSKYGPIEVHGTFGMASGDGGDTGKDNAFKPTFGHRVDGLERSGFGELFGASLYDASASGANPNGLPAGNSGIRVIGGGITTHPTSLLSIGIDYFVFDAMEQASPGTFGVSAGDSSLGSELDIGVGFAYTSYLTFRASAAFFSPGDAFTYTDKSRRYLIEARGRF